MQLDRLAATLRPRRSWEGLDLGFAFARTWFTTLWPLWWISALPGALLALLVLGGDADWWLLLLWWLKPVYEAPLVIWTGRALFGERMALRDTRGLLKAAWSAHLLPFLLWRRFSPARSFNLPIALLEGLGGKAAAERRRVLAGGGGSGAWLTLVCYHFEAILWGGMLLTLLFMVPEGLPALDLESALMDSSSWPYWLSSLLYLLAVSFIAPFYVCAGFALYLTRRTDLEAWDLELAFRRAGDSRSRQRTGRTALARSCGTGGGTKTLAALLIVLTAALPDESALADDLPRPGKARDLIAEILADPVFGRTREITAWVPIEGDEAEPNPTRPPGWLDQLRDIVAMAGPLIKWLLLALAAMAVALLVNRIVGDWEPGGRLGRRRRGPKETLPEVMAEAPRLPRDLAGSVRERLATGDLRGAMALLYRGGIAHLQHLGMEIPDGASEGECLAVAADRLPPDGLSVLRALTRDWQDLAYAHRVPSAEQVTWHLEQWVVWTGGEHPRALGDGEGNRA